MSEILKCSFSLLDTKRKYTGNHRKYVIENAREICYAPITREKIKNREAFGFYGHGRRLLCGKMDIGEVDVITLPDGKQAMVSNIPSNVTVSFDVDGDGTVRHAQEILNTETGKIVSGLNASKVGGFSWACPGRDGGSKNPTTLTGFSGFDYVLAPGFAANRGYVLESANAQDIILESVAAVVGDDRRAEQLVAGWRYEGNRIAELEDEIFESRNAYFDLRGERDDLACRLASAEARANAAQEAMRESKAKFQGVLEGIADALPFFIPDAVMQEMLDGDFTRARGVFESARRVDFSQYPLPGRKAQEDKFTMPVKRDPPEYGSAGYGFNMIL